MSTAIEKKNVLVLTSCLLFNFLLLRAFQLILFSRLNPTPPMLDHITSVFSNNFCSCIANGGSHGTGELTRGIPIPGYLWQPNVHGDSSGGWCYRWTKICCTSTSRRRLHNSDHSGSCWSLEGRIVGFVQIWVLSRYGLELLLLYPRCRRPSDK